MMLLVEVGDKVVEYHYADDTTIQPDQPLRGWLRLSTPGCKESWYRLDRVIAVVANGQAK